MVSRDIGRAELERLLAEETEASERTRDEPLSGRAARKRPTRSVVYSIRLTPGQTEEIQRIAEAAGIPAAGLVRGWVLQGLAAEREGSVEQTGEALSRDVARLRRQLTEPPGAWPAPGTEASHQAVGRGPATPSSFPSRSVTAGPRPPWNGSWTGCR